MESLGSKLQIDLIKKRAPTKGTPENANSERNYYVGKFTNELNKTRGKYPKLGYSRIGKVLSHLSLQDLSFFWKKCDESKNFSATFWYLLKPQKGDIMQ